MCIICARIGNFRSGGEQHSTMYAGVKSPLPPESRSAMHVDTRLPRGPKYPEPLDAHHTRTSDIVDIDGEVFARRLASLMVYRRKEMGRSVRAMARRSDRRFTRRQLLRFEAMDLPLDPVLASAIADLYRIELATLLPLRSELEASSQGVVAADDIGAVYRAGDSTALLETYLRLIRRLRGQLGDDVVALRRTDIDRLASFLDEPGEAIVVRLGALMGATRSQRRAMAGTFVDGAPIITAETTAPRRAMSVASGGRGNCDGLWDDIEAGRDT